MSQTLLGWVVPIVHVLSCVFLIVVVLLQTGKGADMGAVFGGGSQTLFGSGGAGNFLTRLTTATAIIFMLTSLVLTYGKTPSTRSGILNKLPAPTAPDTAPVAPDAGDTAPAVPGAPDTAPAAPQEPAADAGAPAEAPIAAAPEAAEPAPATPPAPAPTADAPQPATPPEPAKPAQR
jgi:preprotein translocase subunit SecG